MIFCRLYLVIHVWTYVEGRGDHMQLVTLSLPGWDECSRAIADCLGGPQTASSQPMQDDGVPKEAGHCVPHSGSPNRGEPARRRSLVEKI